MSAGVQTLNVRGARTPSLFYRDVGLSPVTRTKSAGGGVGSPNQVTAALWRENDVGAVDPPPPPFHTLDDWVERSPEHNTSLSFQATPKFAGKNVTFSRTVLLSPSCGGESSLPGEETQDLSGSSASPQPTQVSGTNSWWSPVRERRPGNVEAVDRDGNGSISGVFQQQQSGGSLTLSAPGEVVQPDFLAGRVIDKCAEDEGWVTIFGFGVDETNSVMREFEKCGRIINHLSGPGRANWVHLQYLNPYDAQKALQKNGMQLNGTLIVGVKRLDSLQRQSLTQKVKSSRLSFTGAPPRPPTRSVTKASQPSVPPAETGGTSFRSLSVIASPAKSTFSKLVDLVFGM